MNGGTTLWLNALVFLVVLGGFGLLALASERQGEMLLHRLPTATERRLCHWLGWPLLAVALSLCFWGWGAAIGPVAFLGWLTVVGALMAFYLPSWPWQARQPERKKPAGKAAATAASAEVAPTPVSRRARLWRWTATAALVAAPIAFASSLWQVPAQPLLRADAWQSQVGPWNFVLAEVEQGTPTRAPDGTISKRFQIRFCEACDDDIRAVTLSVGEPPARRRAAPGASRWTRSLDLALPVSARPDSPIWLTVDAKTGESHRLQVDLAQLAPGTVKALAAP